MTATTHSVPTTGRRRPVSWARLAWVTLRQRRGAMIGLGMFLGLFAIYLAVMGVLQNHAYAQVAACQGGTVKCQQLAEAFSNEYWGGNASVLLSGGAQSVSSVLFVVPVLLGAFLGAPALARELSEGTHRFAWTQGAGRTRWTLSTLAVPAVVIVAATGAFTALFYWYYRPFLEDHQVSEMLPLGFALLGVAFAAWTVFCYALAAFFGALVRRTVPAIVLTLVGYVALATATAVSIRPRYLTPVTLPAASVNNSTGWVISNFARTPGGQAVSLDSLYRNLPASVQNSQNQNAFSDWLTAHHYTQWTSLQPDSRFWPFQLIEGGWLLVLSLVLIAGTVWLVRRRGA
jgi:ABC-type transport system involved in multi-copper enzyme maturation permease subunit